MIVFHSNSLCKSRTRLIGVGLVLISNKYIRALLESYICTQGLKSQKKFNNGQLQYDGSNDDLDWRINFRYLNFICIIKYLRFKLNKSCFIE